MSFLRNSVAAALALGAAGSAGALDVSTYAANSATNVNVYISGSTAVSNTLLNASLETAGPGGVCTAGTIDYYTDAAGQQQFIYCSASTSSGITAGTPLAIFKENTLGSINGVQPLIQVAKGGTSGLAFISPAALAALAGSTDANCTNSTVAASGNFGAYNSHLKCTGAITVSNVVPTGGIADVEANLLRISPGGVALSNSDISTYLTGAPGLDTVWGVAITKNLFYALQTAEGIPGSTPPGATVACASNSDVPVCAPSLSKAQVASILQGKGLVTWNQITGVSLTDNNTYICRRDVGSGTQASYEYLFMGNRCSSSSESIAQEDGAFVFTSGSTGGVRNCLQAFFAGGTVTPYNKDFGTSYPAVVEPGSQGAMGMISLEIKATDLQVQGTNLCNDCFRLVAVDGILPTVANVVNGFYPYFSTDAFYVITAGKTGAPTGSPLAVFNAIQGKLGHPVWTADSNSAYAGRPWGNGGDVAPASLFAASNPPTIPATSTTVATNPTNAYSKASSGFVNNCDTPVLYSTSLTTPPESYSGTPTVNK